MSIDLYKQMLPLNPAAPLGMLVFPLKSIKLIQYRPSVKERFDAYVGSVGGREIVPR